MKSPHQIIVTATAIALVAVSVGVFAARNESQQRPHETTSPIAVAKIGPVRISPADASERPAPLPLITKVSLESPSGQRIRNSQQTLTTNEDAQSARIDAVRRNFDFLPEGKLTVRSVSITITDVNDLSNGGIQFRLRAFPSFTDSTGRLVTLVGEGLQEVWEFTSPEGPGEPVMKSSQVSNGAALVWD